MKNYKIFWCKVNKYYLEKWLSYFDETKKLSDSDFLISSCVVTDKAKSKWIREALKAIKNGFNVYITWCWSLNGGNVVDSNTFYENYPELNLFSDKIFLIWESPNVNSKLNIQNSKFPQVYTKKFVIIQNGCDTNCSFCLTIKKRGPSTNRPKTEIIAEINEFVSNWWKEIVLTWINLAAWWAKNTREFKSSKFASLLIDILAKTRIERMRISSFWPEFLNDDVFNILENERILPYFHISIQSFSDSVLKMMNRNYDWKLLEQILWKFKNLNRSDNKYISLWADVIIWFPWETDDDFNATLIWIEKYQISKLHVFPFSWHWKWEEVPASNFKNKIDSKIINEREKILKEKWDKIREEFILLNKWVKWDVLSEWIKWLTPNYIQVDLWSQVPRWKIVSGILVEDWKLNII